MADGWWGKSPEFGRAEDTVTVEEGETAKLPCVVYHLNDRAVRVGITLLLCVERQEPGVLLLCLTGRTEQGIILCYFFLVYLGE